MAHLAPSRGYLRILWALLRPSWPKRGSFTNVVKAYHQSNDHSEVPERDDYYTTPGFEPSWGHPGEGHQEDQKGGPVWPKRGSFTNVVKAYHQSNDHLEVPEREDCYTTPGFEPSWGHPGEDHQEDQKGDSFLVWFWARFGR